ncbi:MAG: insulinase family protein, partial [Mobilitalea sp.]
MKKKVLLFTAICLLFTVTFGSSNLVSAATDVTKTTNVTVATDTAKTTDIPVVTDTTKATDATEIAPSVGDKISGFKITQIKYDSSTESTQILFQHVKTGARLLVIKNKDINRGFSIKFNTPADNDKGINHIIEHSVLGGSTKYPSSNIIFDVSNTTFISYANAFTYQNMTMYPICSESEVQLLKSADIYLDAVYHPLLLSDQKIFEREGWRYEIADESSALTYNGIVYNEMQGSMGSIESASSANAQKAIFPSSNQGNNSGGDPDSIKTLTYKELIKTYKANYHPSNSLMVLYGDVDYEAFLKMIDENYLSSYSKKTISIDRDTQKAFTKLKEKNYTFPVAVGTDTVNKSVIDLVFATSDIQKLGAFNYVGLSTAVSLLNLDNSHIKQALLASGIAESYSIAIDPTSYQPTIHFVASNADPDKKDAFYKLVMLELKKVVRNGLDTELIKSSLRSLEFAEALGSDSSTAVNQLATVSLYDNLFGDPLMDYNSYYKAIVSKLDENVLENIIDKQLIQNKFAALTVTVPKAGLSEKNQAALTKELSKEKASLSKKELKALIKKVTAFNAWNGQKTSDEVLKSLRAVTLSDIETDVKEREIKESTIDGVKLWTAKADISDISSIYLSFDLSHLTKEELLYLHFYSDMVNNGMATVTRTENQVLNDVVSKAYTVATGLSAISDNKNDTSAHPTFNVNYYGFETEYADTFDLVSDMIFESNTADITTYGTRTLAN